MSTVVQSLTTALELHLEVRNLTRHCPAPLYEATRLWNCIIVPLLYASRDERRYTNVHSSDSTPKVESQHAIYRMFYSRNLKLPGITISHSYFTRRCTVRCSTKFFSRICICLTYLIVWIFIWNELFRNLYGVTRECRRPFVDRSIIFRARLGHSPFSSISTISRVTFYHFLASLIEAMRFLIWRVGKEGRFLEVQSTAHDFSFPECISLSVVAEGQAIVEHCYRREVRKETRLFFAG